MILYHIGKGSRTCNPWSTREMGGGVSLMAIRMVGDFETELVLLV